jgi:hypothetical protein
MRLLVGEQWDQFCRAVMPENAPLAQRREMRRAFYAGAQCILFSMIDKLAPGNDPTDADLAMMSGIQRELSDFADLVKNGRA